MLLSSQRWSECGSGGGGCLGVAAGLAACSSPIPSTVCATSVTYTTHFTTTVNNDLDLVFVIDDGPGMAGWQAKLATQLPLLIKAVQSHP